MRILLVSTECGMLAAMKRKLKGKPVGCFGLGGDSYHLWMSGNRAFVGLHGGLGLVRAAASLQRALSRFDTFDLVVHVGTAGAISPKVGSGDLVVVERTVQHDLDLTELGMEPFEMPRDSKSPASAIAADLFEHLKRQKIRRLRFGGVASGSQYIPVRGALPDRLANLAEQGFACVDMEGAAIDVVAADNNVASLLLLRLIAEDSGHSPADYSAFLKKGGELAAVVTGHLLEELGG